MAARTGDQTHWAEYRKLRNEVVKRQRIEKVSWEEDKLNHLRHGPTKLWRNLKAWLSWSKGGPPTQLNSTETNNIPVNSPMKGTAQLRSLLIMVTT